MVTLGAPSPKARAVPFRVQGASQIQATWVKNPHSGQGGTVRGAVVDELGLPIGRGRLELVCGSASRETHTDGEGFFSLRLPPGCDEAETLTLRFSGGALYTPSERKLTLVPTTEHDWWSPWGLLWGAGLTLILSIGFALLGQARGRRRFVPSDSVQRTWGAEWMTKLRRAVVGYGVAGRVLPPLAHTSLRADLVSRGAAGPTREKRATRWTSTDHSGEFSFGRLPAGQWRITATREGMVPATALVQVPHGEEVLLLELHEPRDFLFQLLRRGTEHRLSAWRQRVEAAVYGRSAPSVEEALGHESTIGDDP